MNQSGKFMKDASVHRNDRSLHKNKNAVYYCFIHCLIHFCIFVYSKFVNPVLGKLIHLGKRTGPEYLKIIEMIIVENNWYWNTLPGEMIIHTCDYLYKLPTKKAAILGLKFDDYFRTSPNPLCTNKQSWVSLTCLFMQLADKLAYTVVHHGTQWTGPSTRS